VEVPDRLGAVGLNGFKANGALVFPTLTSSPVPDGLSLRPANAAVIARSVPLEQ
jgi:hypothetical protein